MSTKSAFQLIAKPSADLQALCMLAYQSTGRKISEDADNRRPPLSPDQKLASCFASFVSHDPGTIVPLVGSHLWFSGFLVCSDDLVVEIVMAASELSTLSAATHTRGLSAVLFSGNLNAWKAFIDSGLASPWNDILEITKVIRAQFYMSGYDAFFNKPAGFLS